MRYGVISDVHANVHALEAVLGALDREGVDRIICAGDIVGYGPRPNECVERIATLDPPPVVVAGNHDLMAIGRLPTDGIGPLPQQTIEWTAEQLSHDAREYLEALPQTEVMRREVRAVKRHPSYARSRRIDFTNGTTAQQRPLFGRRLKQARRGSRGRARTILAELVRWDGNYTHVDANNTVAPGVAIWEEFKTQAELVSYRSFRPGAGLLSDGGSSSHQFDITNGEAYGLRTLSLKGLRLAADRADRQLTARFKTSDIGAWREPRRTYKVMAQGAADAPVFPFFDRGTWQQSVAIGP